MSQSIHHVPGRLRVRATAFRCRPTEARAAQARLAAVEGVKQVKLNAHAGSITIHYDPDQLTQADLLAAIKDAGCSHPVQAAQARPVMARKAGEAFGKALVGAVINKAVERSAFKLVSVLL